MNQTIPIVETIPDKIFEIRKQRVILDRDLAELYGVTTGNLNKALKRNADRFPADFMLQLTKEEYEALRFQSGSLKRGQHTPTETRLVFRERKCSAGARSPCSAYHRFRPRRTRLAIQMHYHFHVFLLLYPLPPENRSR